MLANKYRYATFKTATAVKRRRRGSNMEEVDTALQFYWSKEFSPLNEQKDALIELLKACNTWLKLKKDKNTGGKGKAHFKTRWDAIMDLANAAYAQLGPLHGGGAAEYERKKARAVGRTRHTASKGLDGHYSHERTMWTEGGKKTNPLSATTLTEVVSEITDPNTMAYSDQLNQKYGGNKVFAKTFSAMSITDWRKLDAICQEIDGNQPRARQVMFLKKADRMQYIAIPVAQGLGRSLLTRANGQLWDTGTFPAAYAMDTYGNLFIESGVIGTAGQSRMNHSSFLAGKEVLCAGTLKITNGILQKIDNTSGHYKPTGAHLYEALGALLDDNVDLSQAKVLITASANHGWDNLTVTEVLGTHGVFPTTHPKYY